MKHTQLERLRCEVCDIPTLGDTLCNLHYEEQEAMSAHTPGPWRVQGRYYGQQFRAETIEPNICEMSSSLPPEEVSSNALLIAAAPAMLEALKLAAVLHPHNATFQEAIRLAEGRD